MLDEKDSVIMGALRIFRACCLSNDPEDQRVSKQYDVSRNNEILNNILRLLKVKGVRQIDLARYLGISGNAITQWKINRSSSYMNYLDKIAAFFDVSEEELLHPDKSNLYDSFISPDERELLQIYRSLPDPGIKMAVKKALATFAGCVKPEQHTSEQIG